MQRSILLTDAWVRACTRGTARAPRYVTSRSCARAARHVAIDALDATFAVSLQTFSYQLGRKVSHDGLEDPR